MIFRTLHISAMTADVNLCLGSIVGTSALIWLAPNKILEISLQWHHNGHDSVSNCRCLDFLIMGLFRCRSKKASELCVTGHCEGNSPVTSEFPSQRASNAGNVSFDDVVMWTAISSMSVCRWSGVGSITTIFSVQFKYFPFFSVLSKHLLPT